MAIDLSRDLLTTAAEAIVGPDVGALTTDRLTHLITITQYTTDLILNELERRGEIQMIDGSPSIPYESDHVIPTILTRHNWE